MKTNKNIQHKIENAFKAMDSIETVAVSPFFKDQTLQRLFAEKESQQTAWFFWFTPKLQLVTLVCFVTLNIFAFLNANTITYSENMQEFAESYGLSTTSDYSLLN